MIDSISQSRVIGAIAATIACTGLGIYVLLNNRKRAANKYFAYYNFFLAIWNFGELFIVFVARNQHFALLLDRISYFGAGAFVPFYLKMVAAFTEKSSERQRLVSVINNAFLASSVVLSFLVFTPYIIKDVAPPPVQEVPGSLFVLFAVYFVGGIGFGLFLLFSAHRKSSANEQNRIKYFLLAIFVGGLAAVDYFITCLNPSFPALYHPIEILYGLITAYAILTQQLMEIRLLLRDTTVHIATGLLLACASLVIGILVIALSPYAAIVVSITTMGLLMAFAYDPIRRAIQPAIDRIVFSNRFGYLDELAQLPNDMLEFTNLREMLKFLVSRLVNAGKLEHTAVLMYDPPQQSYLNAIHYNNPENARMERDEKVEWNLSQTSSLIQVLKMDPRLRLKEELLTEKTKISVLAAEELDRFNAVACFGVMNDAELVGIVVLGPKLKKEPFNHQDLKILQALQLRLENFLLQAMVTTQESLNMVKDSHDMKNDVNALSGRLSMKRYKIKMLERTINGKLQALIQKISSGNLDQVKVLEELSAIETNVAASSNDQQALLPVEEDALQRLSNKLQNWSVYGRLIESGFQGTRQMETIDISGVSKMCLERWQPAAFRKNLTLKLDIGTNLYVVGEKHLVEQILDNLVDNGIKATEIGSVILSCQRVDEEIVIKVQDTGCGIPKEHLSMIFKKPFYQGKGRETLEKSTGVGLVLVGQYAKSLNGNVKVESEDGKGSTFSVSLPAAMQNSNAA